MRIDVGGLAALKTELELVAQGFNVLAPRSDSLRYDLGVEVDGKLCRIQVKSRKANDKGSVPLELWTNNKGGKKFYNSKEIDFIALYCPTTDAIYWLPMKELDGRQQIHLRISKQCTYGRCADNYGIDRLTRWFHGEKKD